MKKWICGDLHIHTEFCGDGTLSVEEIVKRSRKYCDFFGFAGHARINSGDNYIDGTWGRPQYEAVVNARKKFPDVTLFHCGEIEFPIPRHTMFVTTPDNNEFELADTLVRKFDRNQGVAGSEKACEEMHFVEKNYGKKPIFMIFNHPNAPDVPYEDLEKIADSSELFKVIVCFGRNERRARQTWDVGGEWDRLLMKGHRIFVRFEGDFHCHFEDGGKDYYPGEFQQDFLHVEENNAQEIVNAYMNGKFYSAVDNIISDPVFKVEQCGSSKKITLEFNLNHPLEEMLIISDGKIVKTFNNITENKFFWQGELPSGQYFRVRGCGKEKKRKYTDGMFTPVFMLNPIFNEGEL